MRTTRRWRNRGSRYFWYCVACGAQNSVIDGECQYCECGGRECKRDNCSDPRHFDAESGMTLGEYDATVRREAAWAKEQAERTRREADASQRA